MAVIQAGIVEIQQEIEEHLGGPENQYGFLLGDVSEYIDSFDCQVIKFNQMIDYVKQHWSIKKKEFEEIFQRKEIKYDAEASLFKGFFDEYFDFNACQFESLPSLGESRDEEDTHF